MKKWMKMTNGAKLITRIGLLAVLVTLSFARSPLAYADTMLKAATTLVSGTSADSYSFVAPSSGTVTAEISSVPWPVPLSALSFSATTASNLLPGSSWSSTGPVSAPQFETFQVGAGTYFAHVMATAGAGPLDLGLYSLLVTFTPSAVPLPAAAGMLLFGLLVLFGLRGTLRAPDGRNESVMSAA
jgi:hypothetical protein